MTHTTTFAHRTFRHFFFAVLLFSAVGASAQGLLNPGFEQWEPSGKPAPFNWEEPVNWKSSNSFTEFISAGVRKTTTSHTGTYACSLSTLNIFGSNVPAAIVNGEPVVDMVNYTLDLMTGGTPFTGRPQNLTGYYQFSSSSDGDVGYVTVILKKYNPEGGKADTIGSGELRLQKVGGYTQFTVPIEYKSGEQPDSVVVAFLSSDLEAPMAGGVLVVDDLVLATEGASVADEGNRANVLQLYPNPARDLLHLELRGEAAKERTVLLYDLLGREVMRQDIANVQATLDLSLPTGVYTCRVVDGEKQEFLGQVVVEGK